MIELRTFDGTAGELAEFCSSVWRRRYANSDMLMSVWTEEFLEWDLFRDEPEHREFLVAAYDGTKLVGVLPCRPVHSQLQGETVFGSVGSYFSVDPDYETEGVAMKLNLEQIRRHRQFDAKFLMGFIYLGASSAQGKQFWLRQPRTMKVVTELGPSIRVLDHQTVCRFERSTLNKLGLRVLGTFQSVPKSDRTDSVRAYQESDLPDCLSLAHELTEQAEFGLKWDESTLRRQLSHRDFPQTLVAVEGGQVAGFINYHQVELLRSDQRGQDSISTAIIDLVNVNHLSDQVARQLFNTALQHMKESGCHLARLLRLSGNPKQTLLRTGFLKQPADHYLTVQEMAPSFRFPDGIEKLHVTFR